jgi:hypothetical protein
MIKKRDTVETWELGSGGFHFVGMEEDLLIYYNYILEEKLWYDGYVVVEIKKGGLNETL